MAHSKSRELKRFEALRDITSVPLPDSLAKYYLQWRQNCLDSIRWLAGLDQDPDIPCTYRDDEIEWLVDYYEQRAMLHWCAAVRAGVVK